MCGIVGAVAQRNVVPILLEGLRRLEYRGYDSAGLVVLNNGLQRVRSVGRVAELAAQAGQQQTHGHLGIAHTRWATHGAPTEDNAHPHISQGTVAVVHNGIIENHEALREKLKALGYVFTSQTDTEVIVHLIHHHYHASRDLLAAVRAATAELHGAYAIGVVCAESPHRLVAARRGSPLLVGLGIEENFIASDVSALLPVTQKVIYLEEGDIADIGLLDVKISDAAGNPVERGEHISELSPDMVELGKYRHFMQKEIHEQPRAIANTLQAAVTAEHVLPAIFGPDAETMLSRVNGVRILACGTSYHAAKVAEYWIESLTGLPCRAEIASEYRYRASVADPDTLIVTLSQSGETRDTIDALLQAKSLGHKHSLSICNVPESALVRGSDLKFLTRAGPEIGVASTKAFTTQLVALFLLTLLLGRLRGKISAAQEKTWLTQLRELPGLVQQVLNLEPEIAAWAERFADKQHALFLGRGVHYPIALEGALKLKEISYIHAEAYPAGELKHGPLALVDKDMPVVAVAPNDSLLEKLKSNLQEVRARGGELYVFADQDSNFTPQEGLHLLRLPTHAGPLSPIVHSVPLQILAYHAALCKGTDVDKPRNLAKSVTVE
ncbi:MAG: glutamine--fructose-6-phosphate transaminase (isomerizing) [Nitrosomonadales bacterium]|nr:MAG: glutamine--fructose-6-phosphate transaminase (isomerizing) [Nitrosomonadales bacterium]